MPANKRYPIRSSPLYKLKGLGRLCLLLALNEKKLKDILKNPKMHYRVSVAVKNGKPRTTETPIAIMRRIHDRLQNLLFRIETPEYAVVLKKGATIKQNAEIHSANRFAVKTDISSFYKNAQERHVFSFFFHVLKTNKDIAAMLARLLTYDGYIPTGSPVSQTISFWAYYPTFEKINALANLKGMKFSLWVDDLMFSSAGEIDNGFLPIVKKMLGSQGLPVKGKKTIFYNSEHTKKITGVIVRADGQLKVPNKLRQSIKELEKQIGDSCEIENLHYQRLKGKLQAARQIEPGIYEDLFKRLSRLKVQASPVRPIRKMRYKRTRYPKVFL